MKWVANADQDEAGDDAQGEAKGIKLKWSLYIIMFINNLLIIDIV